MALPDPYGYLMAGLDSTLTGGAGGREKALKEPRTTVPRGDPADRSQVRRVSPLSGAATGGLCATEERVQELAKVNQALQATIDILRESGDLDQVAARVLQIAAQALGSDACALYESEPSGLVRLKYWCHQGQIFPPGRLVHLEKTEVVALLAAGFTVPDSYLGGRSQHVLGPVVLSHRSGTSVPEFDRFSMANGWDWELNIGVAANGIRAFTLCVYRGSEWPFGEAEMSLADSLAKQLGLAVETRRLAEKARETALAREREEAAEERARELAKANEALRRSAERLTELNDLASFLEDVIVSAIEVTGAACGAIGLLEPSGRTLKIEALVDDTGPGGTFLPHAGPFPEIPLEGSIKLAWEEIKSEPGFWWASPDHPGFTPENRVYHLGRGHRQIAHLPIRVGKDVVGFLALGFREDERPSARRLELLRVLAQQAALAMGIARLAKEEEKTAVAREREQAAEERARELAKVNEALRRGLDRFADFDRLDGYATSLIQEGAAVFGADAAAVIVRDGKTTAFRPVAVVTDGHSWPLEEIAADPFLGTYLEVTRSDPGGIMSRIIEQPFAHEVMIDEELAEVWPAAYEFHRLRYDHLVSRQFPLRMRGRMLGFFAFALRRIDSPTPTQMESVVALAQQFTLALEMTRLADKARETALAREREQAAEARAAELAKVNRSLRESVHVVAHSADFDQSLAEVVLRVSATAGAQMGGLFVYDETANTLCCEFWFENGSLHWERDLSGPPCMRGPFDADVTPAFRHFAAEQQIMYVNLDEIDETTRATAWPEVLDWHLAKGRRATCAIPVSAGRILGVIGLAWTDKVVFSPEQLEILMALSNHAALVMQLRHMQRAAHAATIAREQERAAEQRAAELAQLNTELQTRSRLLEVVAQVSGLLARSPEFERALLESLRLIGEAAQLSRVLVFLARPQRRNQSELEHYIIAEWCAPGVRTHAECGLEVISNEDARQFVQRLKQGDSFWVHTDQVEPPLRDYFERLRIVGTGCAPIFLDNQYAGVVAFDDCFAPRTTETAQVDALTAAANTIAAALQSRRDTERLVCEQQQAAQERAAELAKANDALKRTLDVVAFEPDLNQVLGHVLGSITKQLGSPSSALWLWEQESGNFRTHLVFHEGQVLELTDKNRKLLQGIWGSGRGLHWKDHIWERKPVVFQVATLEGTQERAFFERLGIQSLLGIPLLLGSEIVGSITIRFDTARALEPQELELAQALAHQATMAVQLTRLAKRAGEAALSEERARFAREIHDTLAQGFTGILMQLGAISQVEGDRRIDIQTQLKAMTALAQASLTEARRSVRALRPASATSDLRLDRLVEQFVDRVRLQTEAEVSLKTEGALPRLPQRVESELSGIVQEALHNAVKHARAGHISVSLYFEEGRSLLIFIKDDGIGFDPAAKKGADSFGLIGMQERATSIGASLTVISEKDRGTEIIVQYTAP